MIQFKDNFFLFIENCNWNKRPCSILKKLFIIQHHLWAFSWYKVHPRQYNCNHLTTCFAASAKFYGNHISYWTMIIYALAVTFNSVSLFCPWSINKLFTCQNNNDERSEPQEWVKAEKWEVCAVLLPGEKVRAIELLCASRHLKCQSTIQNEPQQGQATLHPAAKSSNF